MIADVISQAWPDWELIEPEIGHGAYGKVYKIRRYNAGFAEIEYQAVKVVSIPLEEDDIDILTLARTKRDSKMNYYHSVAEKLAREATFMADLQGNPYIVQYYDHKILPRSDGKLGWDVLIRMELLTSFKKRMAEHGFTRQDVIHLGIDLCKALELCRKKDVIHRDIKPENIFISEKGTYKLGDFGVAMNADRTLGGLSKKGTYGYMAPEVYAGKDYGPSIDIYSVGIVLYRLLNNGREAFLPPEGQETYDDRELALKRRMINCELLPYPENDSGQLAQIVLKAAAPYPEDRYSNPEEMRRALETLVNNNDTELMILPMHSGSSFFVQSVDQNREKPAEVEQEEEAEAEPEKSKKKALFISIAVAIVAILIGVTTFLFFSLKSSDVESADISISSEYITVGDSVQMESTVLPKRAENTISIAKWYSSNTAIATIDEDGIITAVTAGTVTITARFSNGMIASYDVRIKSNYTTVYDGVDYADVYDYNYYLATYPDVAEKYSGDPSGAIKHFIEEGIVIGYQGIADFNVLGYAHAYSDLRNKYGSDLLAYALHYINYGKNEGRSGLGSSTMLNYAVVYDGVDYSLVYDYNYYISQNYDVFEMFTVDDEAVLEYFVTVDMKKGKPGCSTFNPISYAYEYVDVRERCRQSYDYYIEQGVFDYTAYYLDYINYGYDNGCNGSGCYEMVDFETVYHGADYSSVYDYNIYRENNTDLYSIFGVDDVAMLEHYVRYGKDEERVAIE